MKLEIAWIIEYLVPILYFNIYFIIIFNFNLSFLLEIINIFHSEKFKMQNILFQFGDQWSSYEILLRTAHETFCNKKKWKIIYERFFTFFKITCCLFLHVFESSHRESEEYILKHIFHKCNSALHTQLKINLKEKWEQKNWDWISENFLIGHYL